MYSDSLPVDLTRARELMYEGKLNEAREIIRNFEKSGEITPEDQLSVLLLKGWIHIFRIRYNKATELGEMAYQMSQQLGSIHGAIEALNLKAYMALIGKLDKGFDLILESEKLMASLPKESLSIHFQQEFKFSTSYLKFVVYLFKYEYEYDKLLDLATQCIELAGKIGVNIYIAVSNNWVAWAYAVIGDSSSALDYAMKSLDLYKKLNHRAGIAASLSTIGSINYYKGDLGQALTSCKQVLSIKEVGEHSKILNFETLGNIYRERGDLDKALKYYKQESALAEELGYEYFFTRSIMSIGSIYRLRGNFGLAIDHLKRSMTISDKIGYLYTSHYSLLLLILIYLDNNSLEQARHYLPRLRDLVDRIKSKPYTLRFMLAKAMILKKQGRTKNRAKAEELLKQVVEEANNTILDPQFHIMALTLFCEHLLEELITYDDPKILNEINPLISQILESSESQRSYSYLAEAKVLQSKLLLIQMDMEGSKKLLTEAQRIAELHGLDLLSQKISHEHDNLLTQSDTWDDIKGKNVPMPERIKLASINGVIDRLQGKRAIDPPEMVDEQPTLLLIIAEGGVLIFSLPFTEEWKRDDALFSSFLSAFTSFSNEFFTKGLDRAKFGDDLILMQSVGPFSICYLFKGQTYPATQKLTQFVEKIKEITSIWQTLEKFYKTSQVLEIQDAPSLESLITKIFIDKNPELTV